MLTFMEMVYLKNSLFFALRCCLVYGLGNDEWNPKIG